MNTLNSKTLSFRHCFAIFYLAIILLLFFLTGCTANYDSKADYYYLNPNNKNLSNIGRVVIVEMDNKSAYPQISAEATEAISQALQKRQVFSLTVLQKTDPKWKSLQLDADSTYSFKQLFEIRSTLNCDAVLVGTVTGYQPYPHTSIGLRLKLIDLSDGQLIWAFEQIWDTADKNMNNRVKKYFDKHLRTDSTTLQEHYLVNISPITFIKFVAYEVAETIKPAD
jgi:hypothetical protein